MKKIRFIFICLLFTFVFSLTSCDNYCDNSIDFYEITKYENVSLQNVNSYDKTEMPKDIIYEFTNLIINANYEYINADDINGWIYKLDCDDITLLVGKYLTVIKNDERKNYYSEEHSLIIEYLAQFNDN